MNLNWLRKIYQPYLPLDEAKQPYLDLPPTIRSKATLFGSRAFGGAKRNSDVDLLVNHNSIDALKSTLEVYGINYSIKESGYSFMNNELVFFYQGHKFQIQLLKFEYDRMLLAVKVLSLYAERVSPLTKKVDRIDYLRSLERNGITDKYKALVLKHAPELLI